jgi:hypothetical protein
MRGMTRARPLVVGLLSILLATACGNSVSSSAPPTSIASPATSAPPSTAAQSPSAEPSATAIPSATVPPAPTDAAAFWAIAGDTMRRAGQTFLTGTGPTNDRIQYEPTASASLIGEAPVVVCIDGVEYEGPNGFQPAPGPFSCGVDAFVDGFRSLGFPVVGYSTDFEQNRNVKETVSVAPDGRWRWDYAADSPQFSGPVSASVWLDPASGKIVEATRTDPIGKTSWTVDYDATFPPVALPRT